MLTLNFSGHRRLFGLAWPIAISMLSYTVMTVADSIFVAQLGTSALAAMGLATIVVHIGFAFPHGLISAIRVVIAQRIGAERYEEARVTGWQGLWLALVFSMIAVLVVGPLLPAVFSVFDASDQVQDMALRYGSTRIYGAFGVFGYFAISAWFQARSDTRTPMVVTVLINGLNIVLDPLFIFGYGEFEGWGISGAAVSTNLSMAVGAVSLITIALLRSDGLGRPAAVRLSAMRAIFRIGGVKGLQSQIDVASYGVFAALLASVGDAHLAGHVIAIRIVGLSFLPCLAVAEAAAVMVGQALGAKEGGRASSAVVMACQQGMLIMLVAAVPFFVIPELLVSAFGAEDQVVAIASDILRLYAVVQIFDAILVSLDSALAGAGDTRFLFTMSLVGAWFVKLPVAALLVHLGWGALGAWTGIAAEIMVLTVVSTWRVRSGAWIDRGLAEAARA